MITCHKKFLFARCEERGYTIEAVMPCVVAQNGDDWTIDTKHAAYPKTAKPGFEKPKTVQINIAPPVPNLDTEDPHGPGTKLSALLKKIGFKHTPNCSCAARARTMNVFGPDWCEKNIDIIINWLRDEASARKLPFVEVVGRLLVKRAIKLSRAAKANAALEATNNAAESASPRSDS